MSAGEHAYEILYRDFVSSVVDFDVCTVQVDASCLVSRVEDGCGKLVPRVAGNVVGQHEHDAFIWYSQSLDGAVDGQRVCNVSVVEPETGRVDKNCPVVCVCRRARRPKEPGYLLQVVCMCLWVVV